MASPGMNAFTRFLSLMVEGVAFLSLMVESLRTLVSHSSTKPLRTLRR